ncbi:MAG: NAD(P)H-quinone oxidoreductase [Acidobacteria bacterium]|nr:NAD(P)H-quinone oxidoreductase [Acidobacteriota bacterium]
MKAILVKDDTKELYIDKVARPDFNDDELLVSIKATALNRADLLQRRGLYPPPPGASNIIGLEMAGEIVEIGKNVKDWKIGDRVFALLSGGGYAEYVNIPAKTAMRIPENLSFEEAAAIPEAFLTAYQAVCWLGGLKVGQKVLIHAGASGVGTAAIQIIREFGSEVYVTVGTEKKQEACLLLGAKLAINYKKESFEEKIKEITENKGVDIILDAIGANYWQQNINSLAMDGRLVIIAAMSGGTLNQVNLYEILRRRLQVIGTTLRARALDYKIQLTEDFAKFALSRFQNKKLVPVIDKIFNWQEVNLAHKLMESNENIGKIVLKIDN